MHAQPVPNSHVLTDTTLTNVVAALDLAEPQKDRHKDSSQLTVWLPRKLKDWFVDYLQRVSYGETTADQLRILLCHLQALDEKSKTLVNPRADRKKELERENPVYGQPEHEICIRGKYREGLSNQALERMCYECKVRRIPEFTACQDVKKERREALK